MTDQDSARGPGHNIVAAIERPVKRGAKSAINHKVGCQPGANIDVRWRIGWGWKVIWGKTDRHDRRRGRPRGDRRAKLGSFQSFVKLRENINIFNFSC